MTALTEIGYSKKPYGKDGFLRLHIQEQFIESFLNARAIFIDIDGSQVPFLIEDIKNKADLIVKLDEVDNPQMCSSLGNRLIFLDSNELLIDDSFNTPVNEGLISFHIFDKMKNECGEIIDIEEYPSQLMAHVNTENGVVLIPIHQDWIIEIDQDTKRIIMDLPEGLIST